MLCNTYRIDWCYSDGFIVPETPICKIIEGHELGTKRLSAVLVPDYYQDTPEKRETGQWQPPNYYENEGRNILGGFLG
jgi:hypothetical protein